MSITTALKARREALRDREAGFTLIELLVVVIIIGILAAVAIPIYIGVQNNAKDSAVKSDLASDRTALAAYGTDNNGAVPTTGNFDPTSNTFRKYGASFSSADYLGAAKPTYTAGAAATDPGAFCLIGKSITGKSFVVTSNTAIAEGTACPTAGTW